MEDSTKQSISESLMMLDKNPLDKSTLKGWAPKNFKEWKPPHYHKAMEAMDEQVDLTSVFSSD